MRIETHVIDNEYRTIIVVNDRSYDIKHLLEYLKKSPKDAGISEVDLNNLETNATNFLGNSLFLQLLFDIDILLRNNDGLAGLLSDCWDSNDKKPSGCHYYTAPIPIPPLLFGLAGNSPQAWRKAGTLIQNYPVGYVRPWKSITGHRSRVILDKNVTSFRCAAELGVVIGKAASKVDRSTAMEHVFGYTIVNDMIGNQWRDFALRNNPTGDPSFHELLITSYYGRGTNGFAPIGPAVVSKDEIENPYDLLMYTSFNGEVEDRSHTNAMVVGIENTIECLSQFMTLLPGSIIHMGTMGIDGITISENHFIPPDVSVDIEIEKIGKLSIYFDDRRESAK
jgi:2-keto-4-pentenoate hydratase/2-oxohepta-3-ene-1,7-dioic acid hydratase in catechol pathway